MRRKRNVKFIRQESWRYLRIKDSWRRPKGKGSRMRRKIRGWPRIVSAGFGNSRRLRGIHPSGLKETLVYNLNDLEGLDSAKEAVRIASTVGEKKALEIMNKAEELNLKVLNPIRLEEESEGEGEEASEEKEGETE